MPHYHLFFVTSEDARSIESATFEAPDDAAALALIAEGDFARPLELWSGYDRIRRFAPTLLSGKANAERHDA